MFVSRVHRLDFALIALMIAAASTFSYRVAIAAPAPGENDGCTTNACKDIWSFYDCNAGQGWVFNVVDCTMCENADGRCDSGGSHGTCTLTDVPLKFTLTTVTRLCDCGQLAGAQVPVVEASNNYTGNFPPSINNRWTCQ